MTNSDNINQAPVVTVVIPTYQRQKLLRRAIISVLRQTYQNVCVLVCDNASNDETEKVVKHIRGYDGRVYYIKHEENIGSYPNFNAGMSAVTTQYFSLLSDDDFLAPKFIETALSAVRKFPRAAVVAMATAAVDESGAVLDLPIIVPETRFYDVGEAIAASLRLEVPNKWSGLLMDTSLLKEIGGVDVDAGPYADAGFVWHVMARSCVVATPGLAAIYMVHRATTSATVKALDGEWPFWWERMIGRIERDHEVPQFVRERIRRQMSPDFRNIALTKVIQSLARNKIDSARASAVGLKSCGHPLVSLILRGFISLWCQVPPVRLLSRFSINLRARRLDRNRRNMMQSGGPLFEFMFDLEKESELLAQDFEKSYRQLPP